MIPLWWQILHKTFICHDSRGSIDCPQRLPFCSKNPRLFWGSRGPASLTASGSTRPQPPHPRKMPEYFPRVNYGDPQAKHARLPSFCWGGRRKKQQALRARRCSFWGGEGAFVGFEMGFRDGMILTHGSLIHVQLILKVLHSIPEFIAMMKWSPTGSYHRI